MRLFLLALLSTGLAALSAQVNAPALPLETAIEIALGNNPNLKLLGYERQISENNVDPAVAGIGPRIDLAAAANAGYGSSRVETINLGPPGSENVPLELDGERYGFIVQPEISWLVFDGGQGKTRLRQLELTSETTALNIRNAREQTVAAVSSLYLGALRIRTQRDLAADNIALSLDRLARAESKTSFGTGSELLSLRAEVDLRGDSIAYRQLDLQLNKLKFQLNALLGRDPATPFSLVPPVAPVNPSLDFDRLVEAMNNSSEALLLARQQTTLNKTKLELAELAWQPSLQLYGNANYLRQNDQANFLIDNRNYGAEIGARANYQLYDGGLRKIEEQNAKIKVEQSQQNEEKVRLELRTELQRSWADYQNSLVEWQAARSDLELFERNFEKTQSDFSTGLVDATVLRNAQLNLTAAKVRIANEIYDIREAELELLRLTGGLVQ